MLYSIITIIQSYLLINQCNINSPSMEGGVLSPGLVKKDKDSELERTADILYTRFIYCNNSRRIATGYYKSP